MIAELFVNTRKIIMMVIKRRSLYKQFRFVQKFDLNRTVSHLVFAAGGALSMMNGYTSTYAAQVSPPSASGFPQINSPTTVDVYGTNGLGYIRAASPQPLAFAVGVGLSIT